jgi:hypothetical protein
VDLGAVDDGDADLCPTGLPTSCDDWVNCGGIATSTPNADSATTGTAGTAFSEEEAVWASTTVGLGTARGSDVESAAVVAHEADVGGPEGKWGLILGGEEVAASWAGAAPEDTTELRAADKSAASPGEANADPPVSDAPNMTTPRGSTTGTPQMASGRGVNGAAGTAPSPVAASADPGEVGAAL